MRWRCGRAAPDRRLQRRLPNLVLTGKDPLAIQAHFHNMFYAYAQRRRGIKVPSGIDMARRDLAARKPLNDAAGRRRLAFRLTSSLSLGPPNLHADHTAAYKRGRNQWTAPGQCTISRFHGHWPVLSGSIRDRQFANSGTCREQHLRRMRNQLDLVRRGAAQSLHCAIKMIKR